MEIFCLNNLKVGQKINSQKGNYLSVKIIKIPTKNFGEGLKKDLRWPSIKLIKNGLRSHRQKFQKNFELKHFQIK